jgi:hypothetical protein
MGGIGVGARHSAAHLAANAAIKYLAYIGPSIGSRSLYAGFSLIVPMVSANSVFARSHTWRTATDTPGSVSKVVIALAQMSFSWSVSCMGRFLGLNQKGRWLEVDLDTPQS